MSLSKKPYRGTRDFFPAEQRVQEYMFSVMRKTAESYGYEPYEGPLLEEVKLYQAKSGEELINDQIYSFTDRGERFVAIRPEMTPTLARMVSQIHREAPKPIRWFSIPNLMRYEKPQKGRLREHWQFNVDIFGATEGLGELEILLLAVDLFKNFGAKAGQFEIQVNDRAIADAVFEKLMKCDEEITYKLYKIVDRSKKVTTEAVDKMLGELNLSAEQVSIFKEYIALNTFASAKDFLSKNNLDEVATNVQKFSKQCDELKISEFINYDPTIVRGLDYYTGIVFEIFDCHPENRRALCGGGSYANLLKIFNEDPLAGIGFGLGDVTLRDFLTIHNLLPDLSKASNDVFVTVQDERADIVALSLCRELRSKNLKVISHPGILKFKKVFPLALKKGAKFAVLMGDREFDSQTVQVKNIETKEQESFGITEIDKILKFING